MQPQHERRRRSDRVTADGYLDGLGERDAREVRAMRDECREEETRLSYARRVLQGQLDIAMVEAQRRTADSPGHDLVEDLPSILSGSQEAGPREARALGFYEPDHAGRRGVDAERFASQIGRVRELDADELERLIGELQAAERAVSAARRLVHEHLDRLQDELVRRYREGAASVDDLVAPGVSAAADDREG